MTRRVRTKLRTDWDWGILTKAHSERNNKKAIIATAIIRGNNLRNEGFGIEPELCRGVAVNAIFGCRELAALATETIDRKKVIDLTWPINGTSCFQYKVGTLIGLDNINGFFLGENRCPFSSTLSFLFGVNGLDCTLVRPMTFPKHSNSSKTQTTDADKRSGR